MEALYMTDKQFDKIIKMIRMIVDNCKDLDEAKKRLAELDSDESDKKTGKKAPAKRTGTSKKA